MFFSVLDLGFNKATWMIALIGMMFSMLKSGTLSLCPKYATPQATHSVSDFDSLYVA